VFESGVFEPVRDATNFGVGAHHEGLDVKLLETGEQT
jgi:hypothetical protein